MKSKWTKKGLSPMEAAGLYPAPPHPRRDKLDEQGLYNYACQLFTVYRKRSKAVGLPETYFHMTAMIDLAVQNALRGLYTARRERRLIKQIKSDLISVWIDTGEWPSCPWRKLP